MNGSKIKLLVYISRDYRIYLTKFPSFDIWHGAMTEPTVEPIFRHCFYQNSSNRNLLLVSTFSKYIIIKFFKNVKVLLNHDYVMLNTYHFLVDMIVALTYLEYDLYLKRFGPQYID